MCIFVVEDFSHVVRFFLIELFKSKNNLDIKFPFYKIFSLSSGLFIWTKPLVMMCILISVVMQLGWFMG